MVLIMFLCFVFRQLSLVKLIGKEGVGLTKLYRVKAFSR